MNERNIIGGITATLLSGFMDFLEPLKWFFLLGILLVLADLRFGIEAARKRGETIRLSRAIRRTINKMVDYLCWILLAGTIGKSFGVSFDVPVLPATVMLVVFGIEINSCFANYFESIGKQIRINIFNFFSKKAEIIELEKKAKEEENNETK